MTKKKIKDYGEGQNLQRDFKIEKREIDEDKRTVELAFSSEEPYERWFGVEVLKHDSASVKLDRLRNGGALLMDHNTRDQIGVVVDVRIDADKVARATVKFSKSQRGEDIFQDVREGIRQLVSVGYRINKYEVEEREGQVDLITVTDWEPYEVSIVAVPADATVGVGRSNEKTQISNNSQKEEIAMPDPIKKDETTIDPAKERAAFRKQEQQRMSQIRSASEVHNLDELGRQAIDEDWSYEQFNEKAMEEIGKRNNAARQKQSATEGDRSNLGMSSREVSDFSIVRLMRAIANPNDRDAQNRAGFELEVTAAAASKMGKDFNVRGCFIPNDLLGSKEQRTLTAGTATDGAELVADNLIASQFINVLRNRMVAMQAGARLMSGLVGNVEIPRQTSGAAAAWISAEAGNAANSEAQFDQPTMSPKDLACYTDVSRRLMQQSTPAIDGLIIDDLAIAAATGLDAAVFYGSGASGQPEGISQVTGVNNFNFAAADPTYAEITRMVKETMLDNAYVENANFVIDPEGWDALSTTQKDASGVEGNFILNENNNKIKGYDYYMTNQITAEDYFFGDFSQVLIGEWGGVEIDFIKNVNNLNGTSRFIMFKTADILIRHAGAFTYCNDGA